MGKAVAAGDQGEAGIGRTTSDRTQRATGVMTTACLDTEINATREAPSGEGA